jgi:hypothetical protein
MTRPPFGDRVGLYSTGLFEDGFPFAHREHVDAHDDGHVGGDDHQAAEVIAGVLKEMVTSEAIQYDGDQQNEGD